MTNDFHMELISGKSIAERFPDEDPSEDACGPATLGRIELSSATLLQAERLLGVPAERIEALLGSRFQEFRIGQYRYDIRLLYAVKAGIDLPKAGPVKLARAKEMLAKLTSETPVVPAAGRRRPFSYTTNIFRDPSHRVPVFASPEDAADWVRSELRDKIAKVPAKDLHRGCTLRALACHGGSSSDSTAGGTVLPAVEGSITVPKNAVPVRELRRDLLDGLIDAGVGPFPVFRETTDVTDQVHRRNEVFEAKLAELYDADPDIEAWFAQFDDLWKGRHYEAECWMEGPYPDSRLCPKEDAIGKAARARVVLFGDPLAAAKRLSIGPRPVDPREAVPCLYDVDSVEWKRWCRTREEIRRVETAWLKPLSRQFFGVFRYAVRRFSCPAGLLFGAKDRDGNWLGKSAVSDLLTRLDSAGIDVLTGDLWIGNRKATPEELYGPIAPGVLSADDPPPAVIESLRKSAEKAQRAARQREINLSRCIAKRINILGGKVGPDYEFNNRFGLKIGVAESLLQNRAKYMRAGNRIAVILRDISFTKTFGVCASGLTGSAPQIVAEDGTLLEGAELAERRKRLLSLCIDVVTGELCDQEGNMLTPEEAFAGIKRIETRNA